MTGPRLSTFLVILALFLGASRAGAANWPEGKMPDYLRDLDRPTNAGDWTLQCSSSRLCQIIGVAKPPRSGNGDRAVVLIARGIAKDAAPSLRLALIDPIGRLSRTAPQDGWRIYARGLPRMPPPLRLDLAAPDDAGARRAADDAAERIIAALQHWPRSDLRHRGEVVARMPRGNLARLLRRMDRLQHPRRLRLSAAEEAEWLKEYHYVTLRSLPADWSMPDDVHLSCDTRTYVRDPRGARIGPRHHLWTADCPEGYKIFLQEGSKEPVRFDIRDSRGRAHEHSYAGLNAASLLEVQIPKKGDDGCGRRLKLGFTGEFFAMIEDRRYDRCRMVPHALWPVVWRPTSWKQADIPRSDAADAGPAVQEVTTQ